ncbi:MAG: beta-ketoacyl synthase chain length factor [Rikenellaceae bacterium]|nr:beta-ketoacyl synthase chain length factor [Rikenellaceae bacterium]
MAYYINAASSLESIRGEINTLIPDPAVRRRMSRIVRSGVATAMDCMGRLPSGEKIDAIITATGMGCLADSEKFLRTMIANSERLLNPTPFIQSTFNTIGAQIALLTSNTCYNTTYTHGDTSFQCALLDALMKIDEGAGNILVGAADEATCTLEILMARMGMLREAKLGEGFYFFILSQKPLPGCLARIKGFAFDILEAYGEISDKAPRIKYDAKRDGFFDTSTAKLLFDGIAKVRQSTGNLVLETTAHNGTGTEIMLECFGGRS